MSTYLTCDHISMRRLSISVGVREDKSDSTDLFLWTFRSFLFICTHILEVSRVSKENFLFKSLLMYGMYSDQNVACEILWVFVKISEGVSTDYKGDPGCSHPSTEFLAFVSSCFQL